MYSSGGATKKITVMEDGGSKKFKRRGLLKRDAGVFKGRVRNSK